MASRVSPTAELCHVCLWRVNNRQMLFLDRSAQGFFFADLARTLCLRAGKVRYNAVPVGRPPARRYNTPLRGVVPVGGAWGGGCGRGGAAVATTAAGRFRNDGFGGSGGWSGWPSPCWARGRLLDLRYMDAGGKGMGGAPPGGLPSPPLLPVACPLWLAIPLWIARPRRRSWRTSPLLGGCASTAVTVWRKGWGGV